jgi:ornithine cyclodeaminase
LVLGTGALAPMAAQAHAAVRDYDLIEVWGRDPEKAARTANDLASMGLTAQPAADLDTSVARADVISTATGATEPLIKGALLRPGAHVDLVGSFTDAMREADDDVMRRGIIFVDSRADGCRAGDLAQPLAAGVIEPSDIRGELNELVEGSVTGRSSDEEITVFKSAGVALEDVAAARLVFHPGHTH